MQTSNTAPWIQCQDAPIPERLASAPAELIEYVAMVNRATGVAEIPEAADPPADFADDVRAAIAEMPRSLRLLLDDTLLGVFFARGLGSSAITDVVQVHGSTLGVAVALDVDRLAGLSANAWASMRENEPFRQDARGLQVTIAHPEQDLRRNAIQFLLLHEFGHVLTAGRRFLPAWWTPPSDLGPTTRYSYLAMSWQIDGEQRIVPNEDNRFALREKLRFYDQPLLQGGDSAALYAELQDTTFPTIYAANNVYDDFADSFAVYVHTQVLNKPFRIVGGGAGAGGQILSDGSAVAERCADKFDFMRRFLQSAD